MKRAKKDRTNRAVMFFRKYYRDGGKFLSKHEARAALIAEYPGDYEWASLGLIVRWDRQARHERARLERGYTTQPRGANGNIRDGRPPLQLRLDTQHSVLSEHLTRSENIHDQMVAAISEPDATRREIAQEARMAMVVGLMREIVTGLGPLNGHKP